MNAKGRTVARWLFTACGVWLIGLGFYFIVLRPPLLPEDPRFMGTTIEQLRIAAPGLEGWLKHVFTVMGGFMAGAGVLTVFVASGAGNSAAISVANSAATHAATRAMGARPRAASWAIGLAGALTVGLMSAVNFALHSDFRWLLLVPALMWLAGFALFVASRSAAVGPVASSPTAGVD